MAKHKDIHNYYCQQLDMFRHFCKDCLDKENKHLQKQKQNSSYLNVSYDTGRSGEAKHSNRSCYANLQLSRTIKTIVNLHSTTCCYGYATDWT